MSRGTVFDGGKHWFVGPTAQNAVSMYVLQQRATSTIRPMDRCIAIAMRAQQELIYIAPVAAYEGSLVEISKTGFYWKIESIQPVLEQH